MITTVIGCSSSELAAMLNSFVYLCLLSWSAILSCFLVLIGLMWQFLLPCNHHVWSPITGSCQWLSTNLPSLKHCGDSTLPPPKTKHVTMVVGFTSVCCLMIISPGCLMMPTEQQLDHDEHWVKVVFVTMIQSLRHKYHVVWGVSWLVKKKWRSSPIKYVRSVSIIQNKEGNFVLLRLQIHQYREKCQSLACKERD